MSDDLLKRIAELEAENAELKTKLAQAPEAAAQLLEHMEQLSQDCWGMAWIDGLEYILWAIADANVCGEFGESAITSEDVALLRALTQACGGWWTWPTSEGAPKFVRGWAPAERAEA